MFEEENINIADQGSPETNNDDLNNYNFADEAEIPPQEEQIPEEPPQQEPVNNQEQIRYQYWQSQFDKTRQENEALKAQLQQAVGYLQQKAAMEAETKELQPPTPPEKPENFDEVSAYNDPTSESWKYRKLYEKYNQDIISYQNKQIDNYRKTQEQLINEAKQKQIYSQKAQELNFELAGKYGMREEEINDFTGLMSTLDSKNLDHLVLIHKALKDYALRNNPKLNTYNQRNKNVQPLPGSMYNGSGRKPTRNINDAFYDTLK